MDNAGPKGKGSRPASHKPKRFIDYDGLSFRGIGWAMLLSLPVWIGLALLLL